MIFDDDPYDRKDEGHGDDWVEFWSVMAIMVAIIAMGTFFVWLYTKG